MVTVVTPFGPEFLVNTQTAGSQIYPSVTRLSSGGYVVCWQDYSGASGDPDGSSIRARLFDASGTALGPDFVVNSQTAGDQWSPVVTAFSGGGFVVAWATSRSPVNGDLAREIHAQIFNNDGLRVGQEFAVSEIGPGDQNTPAISTLTNDQVVIAWQSFSAWGDPNQGAEIKAQVILSDGTKVGQNFQVNTQTTSFQFFPTIAGLQDGSFVISWDDQSQTLGDESVTSIKAQLFNSDGVKIGSEFLVNTQTISQQAENKPVRLDNGHFAVIWTDYGTLIPGVSGSSIKGQIFDGAGQRIGGEILISSQRISTQRNPAIAYFPDGQWIVLWQEDGSAGVDYLRGQIFSAQGLKIGNEISIAQFPSGSLNLFHAKAILTDANTLILTWYNNSGSGEDILSQIMSISTSPNIVSDGGSDLVPLSIFENTSTVTTVAAIDPDVSSIISYSISGGTDAALFQINAETGALSFITPPDFESPSDAGANNIYYVEVQASDGVLVDKQLIAVAVRNANEGPLSSIRILSRVETFFSQPVGEFQVNTFSAGTQFGSEVAALPDGGWVVTWLSVQDGYGYGVYSQRYDARGLPLGGEVQVNTYTSGNQSNARITATADGGWVIIWHSPGQDGDGLGVYGQRFAADGSRNGEEFLVNVTTAGNQYSPQIASLPDGGWVAAWVSGVTDVNDPFGQSQDVYGQRFNDAGVKIGAEFLISTDILGYQFGLSISALSDGGWIATWFSTDFNSVGFILGQRFAADGTKIGNEFQIAPISNNGEVARVIGLPDGGWLVAWGLSDQNGLGGVYYRRYAADGSSLGGEVKVNNLDMLSQNLVSVATLMDGGWVVTWQGDNQSGSGPDVYGQRYNNLGSLVGSAVQINTFFAGPQYRPTVTGLKDGGWVTSWWSLNQDGSSYGVFAQRFDADGNKSDTYFTPSVVATGTDFVENRTLHADATLISASQGSPSVSWQWQRSIDGGVNWTDIQAATRDSYTLSDSDVGHLIRLQGTHTNAQGVVEALFSAASTVIANVNDAPIVTATQSVTTAEDTAAQVTVSGSDVDGDTLTYVAGSASHGTVTGGAGGVFTYTPTANYTGSDSFTVTVSDGNGGTAQQVVTVTVSAVNDAPSGSLQLQIRDQFRINTTTAGNQISRSVKALADGGFVVAWESYGQDGSSSGIYAQRYNSGGEAVGGEFQVNTSTEGSRNGARIGDLADGGFLVTWASYSQDGSVDGIYAQRYDSGGAAVGSEFKVSSFVYGSRANVAVASQPNGGFVVAWAFIGQDGSSSGIYAQRYNSAGEAVGGEFQVNTYAEGAPHSPSIAGLSSGGFVVTWTSNGQDGSLMGVYGQRYDSAGSVDGSEFQVNTYTDNGQFTSSVAGLPDGGFVVTWQSQQQDGSSGGIFAQRYNSSGVAEGGEFRVNTNTNSLQASPSIATLADGGFVVAWTSYSQASGPDIFVQRYNSSGVAVGDEFQVNTYTESAQSSSSIASLANGGFIVTWVSYGQDGSEYGVYGQIFDSSGKAVLRSPLPGSDFSEDNILYADVSLLNDADGLTTISWQWQRSSDVGQTWSDITGATGNSYKLSEEDVGQLVRLKGSYTDSQGTVETVYSTASTPIINVNNAPVGFYVTISNAFGTFAEDATLTANATVISDADGLPDPLNFTYQWQILNDAGYGVDIDGATSQQFTPSDAEVGKLLGVVARYIDQRGEINSVIGGGYLIANVNDAPVVSNAIVDQTSAEKAAWSYVVPVGAFSDVDGDTLTYSATLGDGTALPGWLVFNAATQSFSGTPPQNFVGNLDLKVTASDGSLSVSDTFTLSILPTLQSISGTPGADTLSGIAGSVSAITGGAGNDTITGGSRADIAVYSGNRANYTITTVAGVTTVVDTRAGSPDGTDTLRGLNILRFADVQLFQTTAANKVTLAGQAQTYNVSNSEAVQGTNAVEQFIIAPRTSALVFVGTNDVVDLSGAIDSYSYTATGTQLQISDGSYTTTLSVGGSFTLRTASGSTSVAIDFAANGAIKLGGTQTVGTPTFNPLAAITNSSNVSQNSVPVASTPAPTVEALSTLDKTPTLTGSVTLAEGQTLEVIVNGVTYTTATGVVVGADNRWSLTLPNDLSQGTYDVTARIVPTNPAPAVAVAGTSGADTLSGIVGSVSAITGGAGNDTITGASRADIAVYTGNRANYTITTVAGVTTVVDNRAGSPDGTDTLRGLNILRFADVQLFQTTAANKVTLAGQAQTYNVSNSEAVQGTNAVEQFIIAPRTSALVFVGTNDVVDLSGAIDSYSYTATGTQLQISDGSYTTTLSVGGSFTLRTASGSTSVAIDFAANGAIKLGGTQTVGTPAFNALAAITNSSNVSDNAVPQLIVDTTSAELTILGFVISGASSVAEGQSLTLTISAQGVADGTVIPYTVSGTGIAASDIQGGLTGSFTVTNGQGSITLATNLDRLTEGTEQLLVTLGGAATGTPAFTVNITDISLTPVTVANGQSYTATIGKVDTFIIDGSQSIAATIAGFEVGDVLEFANYTADLGVSFEQLAFGDSAATLYAGNVTINLTGLSNDSFGNEASFEAIYGVGAIGYLI